MLIPNHIETSSGSEHSPAQSLGEALSLAVELAAALPSSPQGSPGVGLKLRMARAHALSLIDQLIEIVSESPRAMPAIRAAAE